MLSDLFQSYLSLEKMESDESEQSSAEETGNSTSDQLNTDSKKKPGTSNSSM